MLHPHAGLHATGHVEVVDPNERQDRTFYMPHHALTKANEEKENGESCLTHPNMRGAQLP